MRECTDDSERQHAMADAGARHPGGGGCGGLRRLLARLGVKLDAARAELLAHTSHELVLKPTSATRTGAARAPRERQR